MIRMACRDWHGSTHGLCSECVTLQGFADFRLDRCPFEENKPTCSKCQIHCYKPEMRERIRAVMRYAGPRMYRRHPILTLYHLLDGFRMAPVIPGGHRGSGSLSKS